MTRNWIRKRIWEIEIVVRVREGEDYWGWEEKNFIRGIWSD